MVRQQVLVVAFEGVRLAGLGLVCDAMALSDRYRARVYGGHVLYPSTDEVTGLQVRVLTPRGGPVRTAAGPRLAADGRVGGAAVAKAVVLPAFGTGARPDGHVVRPADWATVLPWLVRQHAGGALVAAMGSAVLALADAGLLDGRTAVADQDTARCIAASRPSVSLMPGLPVLATPDLVMAATAAGEAELVRELVRRLNSPNTLAWVDAELGGGEIAAHDPLVARFLQLARERFAEPHSVAAIACLLGTTERTLRRHCRTALGVCPSEVIRTLRLDAARMMLGRSTIPVERVGRLVGYADADAFRTQFRREFGHAPSAERRGAE